MKKVTLFAAMAALALGANAQYVTEDAGIEPVIESGANIFYAFVLDGGTMEQLNKGGNKVYEYLVNDVDRFFYIWDNTFSAGDGSAPGVDYQMDGYTHVVVGSIGWSGAGYNQNKGTAGMDFSGLTDETHLHLAYMAPSNPIKSLGMTLLDEDSFNKPAHFAIGNAYVDNGETWPSIAPVATNEWQAVDITFGDLKLIYPKFEYQTSKAWTGNYLAFLGGGVTGQEIALDAFYFYQTGEVGGISNIEMGNFDIVVTGKTINASGADSITLYDLTGKEVKRANSSVLGLNGIGTGLYLVKAGNSVAKVLVK